MPAAAKKPAAKKPAPKKAMRRTPVYRAEEALVAALGAVEKAGKEIAVLAKKGQARLKALERQQAKPKKRSA